MIYKYRNDEGVIWSAPLWLAVICLVLGIVAFAISLNIMIYLQDLVYSNTVKVEDAPVGRAILLALISFFSTIAGIICTTSFVGRIVMSIKNFFLSIVNTTYKFKKQ